jgi:hypothetical protein
VPRPLRCERGPSAPNTSAALEDRLSYKTGLRDRRIHKTRRLDHEQKTLGEQMKEYLERLPLKLQEEEPQERLLSNVSFRSPLHA